MQTTPKANNILGHLFALLGAVVMLAIATWVSASSSEQVKPVGDLAAARTGHTATALSDGKILITGGRDADGHLVAASEIFDPVTATSSASAALNTARVDHSATVLADGRVLVAGGTGDSGALSSAEIFDPAHPENGFQSVASAMSTARAKHTATLLNDGHVLIAGGDAQGSAELFDATTGTFMPTIWPLTMARSGHTATLFSDDSVLLAGGNTATIETYTPNQGFALDPATMSVARTGHWAFELSDTRLLLFQGDTGNTIDEFNPGTGTITPKASLDFHASSSSLLANGKVLVLGTDVVGLYNPDAVPPAPDFTAFDETSVPHSNVLPRSGQAAVQLPGDKKILISGGVDGDNHLLGQALYNPAKIWTDKDDYQPDDPVILSASGWKANEPVYLFAVDNETEQWTYEMTVNADANGGFVVSPFFIVELRHLGVQFHVTAMGAQSTMQAEVYFTDSGNLGYSPSSQSFTIPAGTSNAFSLTVTDPKNNDAITVSPVVTGTGGNPLPGAWVTTLPTSLSFSASSSDQTKTWSVTIAVPPGTAAGTYTGNLKGHATAVPPGTQDPNDGQGVDLTITVPAAVATTLTLTSVTPNSVPHGSTGPVTFKATLTRTTGGAPVSAGTVNFSVDGGGTVGSAVTDALGVATFSTYNPSALTVASHNIQASFPAATISSVSYATSTSSTLSLVVNKVDTSSTVASNHNPSLFGQSVTFTATVSAVAPGTGTPTGTVDFKDGAITIAPGVALSGGSATFSTSSLSVGNHSITAVYNGDSNSNATGVTPGSTATALSQVVNKADSTTSVTSNNNPSVFGQSVTFTATVSAVAPGTGTPTGTVDFKDGVTTIASGVALTGGSASFGTSSLSAGNHSITAVYNGNGNFNATGATPGSTATALSQVVNKADTSSTVTSDLNPSVYGQSVTFTATVSAVAPGTGTPTGTVDFKDGATTIASGVALTGGSASFSASSLTAGNHSITAVYNGDGNFNATGATPGSTATALSQVVNKRLATWTTDPASKTYGDPDPAFTGNAVPPGPSTGFLAADNVTATYTRDTGENASPPTYHITATLSATPLSALDNYIITNDGAEFTINKRLATWTTNPASKTYGDPDPSPLTTGSGSNFVAADGVTATYTRDLGENASPPTYHITATLSATVAGALNNYTITNAGAEFTINKRLATWTTNPASKTYGDPDPSPLATGSGSNFVAADGVTATYTRDLGENASPPTYHITATLSATVAGALNNYTITNDGAEFTINKRLATWTTNPASKTYGDPDPDPLTTGSGSNFVAADGVTATYSRVAGENASPPTYHITATLSATVAGALNNYTITNDGAEFTIDKRSIEVTATAGQFKIYGNSDPVFAYTVTSGSLAGTDSFAGALSRVAGENVGLYAITIGTLAINDGNSGNNYTLTLVSKNFEIKKRSIEVTATAGQFKIYGNSDPVFAYTVTSGSLAFTDSFTGALGRVAGENVGLYAITIGTLAINDGNSGNNYTLSFVGNNFEIKKRPIQVTSTAGQFKIYGEADPVFAYTVTSGSLAFTDSFTGALTRIAGENVGLYAITIGTLAISDGNGGNNYTLTFVSNNFEIKKRPATWTTNAADKIYGESDPAFTGSGQAQGTGNGFLTADNVTATYSRVSGENASPPTYHISATLAPAGVLSNYMITNNGAEFTINKRPATWTTNPASKFFGASDPNPLTTGSGQAQGLGIGFLTADNVTATYSRVAGEAVSPPTYHITATLSATPASALNNYNITNTGAEFTINHWTATGFYQPVDMLPTGVVNTVKGGSTVPLKFNIYAGNVEKTSVSDVMGGTLQVVPYNCQSSIEDPIGDLPNTGGTALRYDTTGHQFIQNWQTPKAPNKCYRVIMTAADNTTILEAYFKTK